MMESLETAITMFGKLHPVRRDYMAMQAELERLHAIESGARKFFKYGVAHQPFCDHIRENTACTCGADELRGAL